MSQSKLVKESAKLVSPIQDGEIIYISKQKIKSLSVSESWGYCDQRGYRCYLGYFSHEGTTGHTVQAIEDTQLM